MKKLLLLSMLLALGVTSLGASNQQMVDSTLSATTTGDSVGAGVPFEVKVNILPKGPWLVITDENKNVYDQIVFDHGTKLAGTLSQSKIEKTAILRRTDGHPFSADVNGVAGSTTYNGKFEVETNNNYDPNTNILTLDKLSSAPNVDGTPNTQTTLHTEFNFIKNERLIKATDNEMRTLIQSVILAGTKAEPGLYVGNGIFKGSLTVK